MDTFILEMCKAMRKAYRETAADWAAQGNKQEMDAALKSYMDFWDVEQGKTGHPDLGNALKMAKMMKDKYRETKLSQVWINAFIACKLALLAKS